MPAPGKPPYPARLHRDKWWCEAHGRVAPCPMCSAMYGQALQQPSRAPIYVSLDRLAELVDVATIEEAVEAVELMKDDPVARESARIAADYIDSLVEMEALCGAMYDDGPLRKPRTRKEGSK